MDRVNFRFDFAIEKGIEKHWDDFTKAELIEYIQWIEDKALNLPHVGLTLCGSFDPDNTTSSATKCKCGREKWEHPKPRN